MVLFTFYQFFSVLGKIM